MTPLFLGDPMVLGHHKTSPKGCQGRCQLSNEAGQDEHIAAGTMLIERDWDAEVSPLSSSSGWLIRSVRFYTLK